ncbi:MAG: lectin like domain-containing protein [bacterium]|nr:lectin like domain-containing protein [bacterium]
MKKMIIVLVSLVLMSIFTQFVFAQDPVNAPLNPDFLKYLEDLSQGKIQAQTADGHPLGYFPPSVDLSHLKGQQISWPFSAQAYATRYDLREENKLTPIRDQGAYGTCWAHATYSSLESCLLPNETWDFSENNMANEHGFDWGFNDGGHHFISTAYLVRWGGPINEADDVYPNPAGSPSGLTLKKHVQEVLFLPARSSATDNDNIKQSVITYGAVYTCVYSNDNYYNSTNHSYYYNGSQVSDHCVAIVGWDDNYSRNNFTTVPPGNGAFIVKNNWGTTWGEEGYFYVSYYDEVIGTDNAVFNNAESITNYYKIYQYDPLGWVSSTGYSNTTGWFANIFTAASAESLRAVGFYTAALNSTYEIRVYKDSGTNPIGGTLAVTKTGSIALPGYHTIALDSGIALTTGQKFSVVVKLTTPGYNYPIPLEQPYYNTATGKWYSSAATSNANESFISSNGTTWLDLTTHTPNGNVCLKAYTGSTDTTAPANIAYIYDGVGADIDTINSKTVLSANWATATDLQSSIARYWYGIGTTAGGTDVMTWTDVGVSTYVVKTGLALTQRQKYYIAVKAENGAGLLSGVTYSDGQTVVYESTNTLKDVYNWPNPGNPNKGQAIKISKLPLEKTITIKIYNLVGELVRTLEDGKEIIAGIETKTATWDGKNENGEYVASGVYAYVIDTGEEQQVGKIAVVK